MIDKTISHYRILEKIGTGGMGDVYKAEDTKLKRIIVLKFLPSQLITNQEFKKRFEREAQAAAALNHPNIITVYEINEFKGQLYIAMEYVEGQTLKEKIISLVARGDEPAKIENIINFTMQICEGLKKAHKAGIVHRDIKPQNILVNQDNRVKILDFGMAKLKGASRLTEKFFTIGTVHYMSPEQINGDELDQRSDIWSLGVVMFEMITNKLPFTGEHPQAIIHSILNKKPELITNLQPGIPIELEIIISKALVKNRNNRYQNVEEMIRDLHLITMRTKSGAFEERILPEKSKNSIAVLSFVDMSPKKDQEYFCDGIAEELINSLTKIEDIKVASRTSSFQFKGKECDIFEIGKKINVQTVLEGSVRKVKNRLRITTQLTDVADGYNLWSECFDRGQRDIFAIQEEITKAIIENLKVKLLEKEREKPQKRYTENAEAYRLYLKGRYFWNKRYEGGLKKSIEYFNQAITKDPFYALPYVGIADSFNILGFYGFLSPNEAFSKAKVAAKKALEIDDNLGEAHASLGWISTFYDWDWQNAEREYLRSIELNPNYATAHAWYALYLIAVGRTDESITEAIHALELDPLSLIINSLLGIILILARRYDEASEQLVKTLEMDPNFLLARIWMGEVYLFKEMYKEAIEEFQKAVTLSEGMTYALADLGLAYALSGQKEEALKILDRFNQIATETYVSMVQKSHSYIGLGWKDVMFEHFEKAYLERDSFLVLFKTAPHFDKVRKDPRFKELLKKIGLN